MKEYNRKTKKWEEKEKAGSLKKRETCRGGKEHDFVLVLPKWVRRTHNLSKDEILTYYKIESDRDKFDFECDQKLKEIGVDQSSYLRGQHKYYICSVCKKEKYEEDKKDKVTN